MKNSILTFVVVELLLITHHARSQSSNTFDASTRTNLLKKDLELRNYANLTSIGDILELFSVDVIGSQWLTIQPRLSTICARNMMEYLSGLEKKEIWAIKSKLAAEFISCFRADAKKKRV